MTKRGSRRKSSKRAERAARAEAEGKRDFSALKLWSKRIALWGGALVLLGALFLAIAVGFAARSLPSFYQLKATQNAQTIVVRARDGTEIVELGPSYGKWLSSEDIPQVMKDAMISVEDRRFYSHPGVDIVRLTGAVIEGVTGERSRVGGTSTISQQLARNVFLNSNRTLDRKAREAVLAMALEWKFSKEQILELYLNKVYFGGGAYGIDSASRKFFSHPATELSTAEAAIIAGLVKAPSRYSPTADVDAAVGRASVVLQLMKEQGRIPQNATVDVSAVKLKEEAGQNSVRYFTDWALPQLDLLLPETFEPIEVWTTLDPGMQAAATAAVKANAPDGAQGALVSLDRDGAILALVGGTDYVETNYNRATNAMRQPGSSWKLFVYLAALEAGYTPEDRVVDTPVSIGGWSPRNSNGRNIGETNLRTAFAYSINTVAAQLGNEVGFSQVASMARRFGVTTPINTYPAMVLGANEVRLLDMTRAFAAVSAEGASVEPYGIVKVTTAEGELLYQHEKARSTQLIPDHVARGITDLLQAAVQTGTGRAAQIGRPVAGKTGTTSSNKDGYFVGFSSGITTGVWMGRDDNRRVGGLQGGRAPAQAFAAYMRYAVKDRPVEEFDTELQLPEWQLDEEDDYFFGDPDDYYYIDEQGNLIEPGRSDRPSGAIPFPEEGGSFGSEDGMRPRVPAPPPVERVPGPRPTGVGEDGAPQAIGDDFLDGAIGRDRPPPRPERPPRN
ncbi:transglycosylase domain-containing protein [Qipengyuania aquimaris]|uniref:PBP1A family penicillin-binding protein n=1 Tax=Qipengyuania aquimaris TaxID=255984 RepID=A0A9Q3XCX3_9SPHN|nr:PBP1A family penicillin-binding protein [Qipengyuania aquimaris]MBY6218693.1 PBP1A family penicillin-binding protein [Qipengyuania aquimaris]